MGQFLEKYGFKPSNYYKVVDGVVYRNVAGVLTELHNFCRVGRFKIYVEYHPHTTYSIIVDGVVYQVEYSFPVIDDMIEDLELLAKGFACI